MLESIAAQRKKPEMVALQVSMKTFTFRRSAAGESPAALS
jgi:hypothetical protein